MRFNVNKTTLSNIWLQEDILSVLFWEYLWSHLRLTKAGKYVLHLCPQVCFLLGRGKKNWQFFFFPLLSSSMQIILDHKAKYHYMKYSSCNFPPFFFNLFSYNKTKLLSLDLGTKKAYCMKICFFVLSCILLCFIVTKMLLFSVMANLAEGPG